MYIFSLSLSICLSVSLSLRMCMCVYVYVCVYQVQWNSAEDEQGTVDSHLDENDDSDSTDPVKYCMFVDCEYP